MRFVLLANPTSVHTVRWARNLRARGHDVTVVSSNEEGRRGVAKLLRWLRRQLVVRRLVRAPGVLLVVHYVPAGMRALALLGLHPRVGVAWGSDILRSTSETRRRALRALLQRRFLRGCDAVVATSDALAQATIAAGARPERTQFFRFGVDLDRYRPGPDPAALRARLGLVGRRVVLSNRTIGPIYRQATVVEALARLPSDVVVLMTRHAAVPSEIEAVERRARELGVVDRVQVLPQLDDADMPELYGLADVVVSVPESDGGSNTIIEAMASGRPIVATNLPSVAELLGDIEPELLVPVGDAAATALAIERVLNASPEDEERRTLRRRARAVEVGDERDAVAAMESLHRQLVRP